MLSYYSEAKNKLKDIIAEVNKIARSKFTKEILQLTSNKLEANVFTLVVVGQFKRGKTTFINTLLGKDLLPTSIIPLTSIITILKYGEKIKALVLMNNGLKKEIPIDDIKLYVTEKYNPKNKKGVDSVEVFYPSPYLKSGVQIVDTPGVASVHEHNTKTTYQYLPQADVSIFLISVDPPITQAELQFLKDVKKITPKIFFVQNKIDMVSTSERQEALEFTKTVIKKQAKFQNVLIYQLSAKEALEGKLKHNQKQIIKSGLLNFEKSLEQFLLQEKGNILLSSSAEKIRNIINEELILAELEEKSLRTPLKELENKLAYFKAFLTDINQEYIDSERLLAEETKELQKEVLETDLEKLKEEKTKLLITKINELAITHKKESNRKFIELLNEFLANQIREIFAYWQIEEEGKLKKYLKKIINRFINHINNIFEKIFASSSELFGISPREIKIQETLPAEIEFRFQIEDEDDMLSLTLNAIKKTLPKTIAHKIILNEAIDKTKMLVDRHCGKLRYDFSQRIEKLVRDYKVIFGDAVEETQNDVFSALETGLSVKQKTEVKISNQEINLRNRIAKLNELKKSLQNL